MGAHVLASIAVIGCALLSGCRCGDLDAVTATLKSPEAGVWARRRAIRCVTSGERVGEKWPCPLPEQESWRSRHSLRPIAYALADSDSDVRREGLAALELLLKCTPERRVDADAARAFGRALKGADPSVRASAVIGLAIVGEPAQTTSVLVAVLADEREESGPRRAAAEMLCTMGDASAVPALVGLLGKWDGPLQLAALRRLAILGPGAQAALPAVVAVLRDGPPELRPAAAEAIAAVCAGAAGSCAASGAIALVDSFGRADPATFRRSMAPDSRLRALAALGEEAMAPLTAALEDPRPSVRRLALEALGGLWQLGDGSWSLRRSRPTAHQMAQLYCAGSPAVTQAIALLRDPDRTVSTAAEASLTGLAGFLVVCPSTLAALDKAAQGPDPHVRQVARQVRSAGAVGLWTGFLEDGHPIREANDAEWSLPGRFGADHNFVNLPDTLASSLPDPGEVRLEATITSTGAVRAIRILESKNASLASACVAALRKWRYSPGTRSGRPAEFVFTYKCRTAEM